MPPSVVPRSCAPRAQARVLALLLVAGLLLAHPATGPPPAPASSAAPSPAPAAAPTPAPAPDTLPPAPDLSLLTSRPVTRLDTLRQEVRQTRLAGDLEQTVRRATQGLTAAPGDGWLLREVVLAYREAGRAPALERQLAAGTADTLLAAPLAAGTIDEAGRAFMQGLAVFYRGREVSARERMERALELRPGWAWPLFYLARIGARLLRPEAETLEQLTAALRDPDCAPAVAVYLSAPGADITLPAWRQPAGDAAPLLRAIPWTAAEVAGHDLFDQLAAGDGKLALFEAAWSNYREAYGPFLPDIVVRDTADLVTHALAPRDGLRFCEARLQEAPLQSTGARRAWQVCRATIRRKMGWFEEVEEQLRGTEPANARVLRALLRAGEPWQPAALLVDRARRLAAASLYAGDVSMIARIDRDAGLLDDTAAVLAEAQRENPRALLVQRFSHLLASNLPRAQTLLDSLQAAGAPQSFLRSYASAAAEDRGDTLALASLAELDRVPHWRAMQLARLADIACRRGRLARGRALEALALAASPNDIDLLLGRLVHAVTQRDTTAADAHLAALDDLCPSCPAVRAARIHALLRLQRYSAARAALEEAAADSARPALVTTELLAVAVELDARELADRLLAEVASREDYDRNARSTAAWVHVQRREMDIAQRLLANLIKEFPGRAHYRSLLLSAGGAVPSLAEVATPEPGDDPFAGLHYDLEDTAWIAAARDSDRTGGDASYLLYRTSYVCDDAGGYHQRQRRVIHLHNQDGLQAYQTIAIPFRSADGIPSIRVARVLKPDGTVRQVKRSDIVISAPKERGTDVSDVRQVVIPFPDLEAGAVLDLVDDTDVQAAFGGGWSFRHLFGAELPSRVEIADVQRRTELDLTLHGGEHLPAPTRRTEGLYEVITWRLEDLEPLDAPDYAPNFYARYPWFGCSTLHSWSDAGSIYHDLFWHSVGGSAGAPDLVARARELTRDTRHDADKLQALLTYVSTHVKNLAIELGRGSIVPTPAMEVLDRGYGDCKDKAACLISMLEAAGIEAEPVLVRPRSNADIRPEFPELAGFTHVVVHLPHVGGGVFCDPTDEHACTGLLAQEYMEAAGLAIPRRGRARLIETPRLASKDTGFDMTIDLVPLSDREARIDVRATYRGQLAHIVGAFVSPGDSTDLASYMVDRCLSFGLFATCERQSWEASANACNRITLHGTYHDTVWADEDQNAIRFRLKTEVADPFLAYPGAEGRTADVQLPHPFRNTVRLRFYEGAGWHPDRDVAPISAHGDGYRGRVRRDEGASGGAKYVEVQQQFELERTTLTPEEFATFRGDWQRFLVGVYQPYHYRKVIDEAEMKRLLAFARRDPEDGGFAVRASQRILGSDAGGDGEEGNQRRAAARALLEPLVHQPEMGGYPALLLAQIWIKEGRYLTADSLLAGARQREPHDLMTLVSQVAVKREIGDLDGEIDALNHLLKRYGSDRMHLLLIESLHAAARRDEASRAEQRYALLQQEPDTSAVLRARLQGKIRAFACEEAAATLAALHERPGTPDDFDLLESSYYQTCGPMSASIPILERIWSVKPVDPAICNNLSWAYAITGTHLDRAEELVNAAVILSDDVSYSRNTLATIYARRGNWHKARALYETALAEDDRPPNQVTNEYLVGLCDYELGHHEEAFARWRHAQAIGKDPQWQAYIARSLALAEQGGRVEQAIFQSAPAADGGDPAQTEMH